MNYDLQNKSILSINPPIPGGENQLKHLLELQLPNNQRSLIIGSVTDSIAAKLSELSIDVNVISDNYESLLNTRMILKNYNSIKIKMMDFAHTDFEDKQFNLIFTQGSITTPDRKNIIKEIRRILLDDGIFSVGEIVSLKEPVAGFVKDIWEQSGLDPFPSSSILKFYESKGFEVVDERDFSDSMKDYYEKIRMVVSKASKEKKEENKKVFTRMKHESNAYLKLGGDKYIGFKSLILRKSN